MKAISVFPGKPDSVHLAELKKPSLEEVPNGRGVLVKVLRVGVDGTAKEINAAAYGAAPSAYDFLVIGHEGFGRVEAVGPSVTELKPGDYVVATVRRPGHSIYDLIGTNDMTTDDVYYERGINLRHGFLTEYYVDDVEYIVKVPQGLKHVGVLLEPFTVVEKGIHQAYEIQRRLKVWRPRRAAVMGAGTIRGTIPDHARGSNHSRHQETWAIRSHLRSHWQLGSSFRQHASPREKWGLSALQRHRRRSHDSDSC